VPRSGFPQAVLVKLLDERNLRMRDASLPLLQRGPAFIALGAAHLPGENGLLRLLELEGYRVESPVSAALQGMSTKWIPSAAA
jgi:uncharacterized protein YbaP (TraB family)